MLFDVFVRRRRALMPAIHASSHEIKKKLCMVLCFYACVNVVLFL